MVEKVEKVVFPLFSGDVIAYVKWIKSGSVVSQKMDECSEEMGKFALNKRVSRTSSSSCEFSLVSPFLVHAFV